VSVPLPADIAAGDITILVAETDPTGTVTITVTGGQAWTVFTGSPISVTSGSKLYVWWRRHIAGNTAPSVQASVDHVCAGCTAYSGCVASGDPVHVVATGTEAASDTSFQFITGLTTTVADCLCACICTSSADSNTGQFTVMTNGNLSNMAEKMDYETTSGHGGGFAFDQGGLAVAGAMGTFAATLTAAWPKAYIAFALKPPDAPVYVDLAGAVNAVSGVAGAVDVAGPTYVDLAGALAAASGAAGALEVGGPSYVDMSGTVAAVASVVAALTAEADYVDLAGSVAAVSGAEGAVTIGGPDYVDLGGDVAAVASVAGAITVTEGGEEDEEEDHVHSGEVVGRRPYRLRGWGSEVRKGIWRG
jgi:hypothetical protein